MSRRRFNRACHAALGVGTGRVGGGGGRRSDADRGEAALAEQVQALGAIGRGWPASSTRSPRGLGRLETANREVTQRIEQAIETIRGMLVAEG